MSHDAMIVIRSDLIRRIDGIAASASRMTLATLCEQIDAIRRIARQHGLDAVEGMASLIETATAYHGHGPVILSYLDLMRDAAASDVQDCAARTAYTAAAAVRLSA